MAQICYGMTLELFKRRLGEGDIRPKHSDGSATQTKH
jgi:hypothetical protein